MFKMTSSSFSHQFESCSCWTANFSDKSSTLPSAEIEFYIQLFCVGFQMPNTCLFVCWVLALTQNISYLTRLLVKKRNQDHAKGTICQPLVLFCFCFKVRTVAFFGTWALHFNTFLKMNHILPTDIPKSSDASLRWAFLFWSKKSSTA